MKRTLCTLLAGFLILVIAGSANFASAASSKSYYVRPQTPILIQLPGPGGLRRSVAFMVVIEVADQRDKLLVAEALPKFRARFFEALSTPPLVASPDDNFDVEEVKRRLKRAADTVLDDVTVKSVLIKDIHEVLIR